MTTQTVTVELDLSELTLLIEALDSHEYWQLSEAPDRNDGYSTVEDGADAEIDAVRGLMKRLERERSVVTTDG